MVSMGRTSKNVAPRLESRPPWHPSLILEFGESQTPDKGQRLWSQCHPTADDDGLHGCFHKPVLSYLAVLPYFHLLNSIKLDIYWPQTIFCAPVTQKWLHFKNEVLPAWKCITETRPCRHLWIINTGDSSCILGHGTFFPNALYYIHLS